MLKKWISVLLALVMLLSLTACSKDAYDRRDDDEDEDESVSDWGEYDSVTTTTNEREDAYATAGTIATTAPIANAIDPFAGISFTATGISPYCEIAVNTAGCSDEAQRYVSYTLDKEHYANGETAVVTATLVDYTGGEEYTLKSSQTTYTVSGQPEYITSVEGLDLTFLKQELDTYITAKTAASIGTFYLFDVGAYSYCTYNWVGTVKKNEVYLTSAKKIKEDANLDFYNSLNFIYTVPATVSQGGGSESRDRTLYVNIVAYNVVKYPDGSIKWGIKNPDSYEFKHEASGDGVSYMVTTCISVQSADYNITKVE